MMEALSLVIFAGVMYFCLVVAPTVMESFKIKEYIKTAAKQVPNE